MKKIILLALSFLLVFSLAACSTEETDEKSLTIGVSGEYYPFCFTESDELKGYEIDFWNEFGARTGYKIEFVTSDFTGLFGMLDTGKVATIGYGIAVNAEREEKYFFSDPYLYSNYNLVTLDTSALAQLEDFVGKRVGVVMGGEGERRLNEICTEQGLDITIVGYEGSAALDEDLRLERIDARLAPQIQTAANIAKNQLNFSITDVTIYSETDAYPFQKENEALAQEVNTVVAEMRADGSLGALSETWFGIDATIP